MQIFVDMDGVLADFGAHHEAVFGVRPDKLADDVDWSAVRKVPNFYLNIPPMAGLPALWSYIAPHKPVILTGVPASVPEARNNKKAWVERNLGGDVEVRCCRSREKCQHAEPGDVLIDDWEKYRTLWIDAGGVWITHRSAVETIQTLADLGVR